MEYYEIYWTKWQIAKAVIVSLLVLLGLSVFTLSRYSDYYISDQVIIDSIVADIVQVPGGEITVVYKECGEIRGKIEGVKVSDFSMGAHIINTRQWIAVMGRRPDSFNPYQPDATTFNRRDALAFMARLSELTGVEYRLPTEAQWEYAAQKGSAYGISDIVDTDLQMCADRYMPFDSLNIDTLMVDPCVVSVPKGYHYGYVIRGGDDERGFSGKNYYRYRIRLVAK